MFKQILFFLFALVFALGATFKAPAQVTPADYQRADSILKLNDLVYNQVNSVNWIDSTSVFWYSVKTREGMTYTMVDAAKATRKPAFDVPKLVEQLNKQAGSENNYKVSSVSETEV